MSFLYPVSLNLVNKKCLVIGGGEVAERKIRTLLTAHALVEVISPEVTEKIKTYFKEGKIIWRKEKYSSRFLNNSFLVIAATNNRKVNKSIALYCQQNNILINVIDSLNESSFIVNAFTKQGDLMLSVSTNGKSPALSRKIKEDLKKTYGPEYAILLEILSEIRKLAPKTILTQKKRREFFQDIIRSDILDIIKAGRIDEARERVKQCLLSY